VFLRASLFFLNESRLFALERQYRYAGHIPKAAATLAIGWKFASLQRNETRDCAAAAEPGRIVEVIGRSLRSQQPSVPTVSHAGAVPTGTHSDRAKPITNELAAFAEANGLRVTARHSNRMLLDVSASAGDIEKGIPFTSAVVFSPRKKTGHFSRRMLSLPSI